MLQKYTCMGNVLGPSSNKNVNSCAKIQGTRLFIPFQVKWAEQQVVKRRVKRDYNMFNDPKWPRMWYLWVSFKPYFSCGVVCSSEGYRSLSTVCLILLDCFAVASKKDFVDASVHRRALNAKFDQFSSMWSRRVETTCLV